MASASMSKKKVKQSIMKNLVHKASKETKAEDKAEGADLGKWSKMRGAANC